MSLVALGLRPTQPRAGLPPVQADQSSLERNTMLPMMGLLGLLEGWRQVIGDAVMGSEVGVEDTTSESMEQRANLERSWKRY